MPSRNNKRKYLAYEDVARNLIFIDGVTRTGKKLFGGIISSLECVEHLNVAYLFEWIMPALSLGSIDAGLARTMLRNHVNVLALNALLGRHINFRYDDLTSVFNYKYPGEYFHRLGKKDGDSVIAELRTGRRFFPFVTHDMLSNLESLNKMEMNYYMLEVLRHPIDVVYSWWTKNWGTRYGKDPRIICLTLQEEGRAFPWYCVGYEKEWLKANPMERCLLIVVNLTNRLVRNYKNSKDKSRIYLLKFEDFVQNPAPDLKKICSFFNTKPTEHTKRSLARAGCPRKLDPGDRKKKMDKVRSSVREKYFDILMELSRDYENGLYGLRR